MVKWIPDDCKNGTCLIEAPGVGFPPAKFLRKCARHGDLGIDDDRLHNVIVISSRRREKAKRKVQLELGVRDEIAYRVNEDGSISILSGVSGSKLDDLRNLVNDAISGMEGAPGVSDIKVE